MFNFNKKKFRKILSPINTLLDNFFGNFKSSNKNAPIKKKFNYLDNKIESFFDKIRNLKKYNQSKKKLGFFKNKFLIKPVIEDSADKVIIKEDSLREEIEESFEENW